MDNSLKAQPLCFQAWIERYRCLLPCYDRLVVVTRCWHTYLYLSRETYVQKTFIFVPCFDLLHPRQSGFRKGNYFILLYKLDHPSIRGHATYWFRSYLTVKRHKTGDMCQLVCVWWEYSKHLCTTRVCLRTPGISDIRHWHPFCIVIGSISLFADDTTGVVTHKNLTHLKCILEEMHKSIIEWFSANQLSTLHFYILKRFISWFIWLLGRIL